MKWLQWADRTVSNEGFYRAYTAQTQRKTRIAANRQPGCQRNREGCADRQAEICTVPCSELGWVGSVSGCLLSLWDKFVIHHPTRCTFACLSFSQPVCVVRHGQAGEQASVKSALFFVLTKVKGFEAKERERSALHEKMTKKGKMGLWRGFTTWSLSNRFF